MKKYMVPSEALNVGDLIELYFFNSETVKVLESPGIVLNFEDNSSSAINVIMLDDLSVRQVFPIPSLEYDKIKYYSLKKQSGNVVIVIKRILKFKETI